MMESSRIRRAQFLTERSLQVQYVALVLGCMVAVLAVAGVILYVTGWSQLVERLTNVYPQGRLQEILRVIYLRLVIGFLALLPLAVTAAIIVSHRVAGPLVRIKRYLRFMARGEFDLAPLELRRYDELKDLAVLINEIIAKARARGGAGAGPRE